MLREAADPGDYAAEVVRHLPGGVEAADAARRKPGDGVAVCVFAQVVLCADLGEYFVAQKADVAVAHRVVKRAAHGVLEGAVPLVGIAL